MFELAKRYSYVFEILKESVSYHVFEEPKIVKLDLKFNVYDGILRKNKYNKLDYGFIFTAGFVFVGCFKDGHQRGFGVNA